jgi:hypothetical protein
VTLSLSIGALRNRSALRTGDVFPQSLEIIGGSGVEVSRLFTNELIMKFNSISWGARLVELFGPGYAGWESYEGVFVALVPRGLMPGKAVPGSSDGTYWGHSSRIVMFVTGANLANNVNVSPAAITIWQIGFLGLILFVACNVVQLYLINSLLLSPSLAARTLGFYLIGIPGFFTLVVSPDVMLVNVQRVILIYVLLSLAHHFLNVAKHKRKSGNSSANWEAFPSSEKLLLTSRKEQQL